MDWIYFTLLIIGFGFFLVRIISNYMKQAAVFKPQIEQLEIEKEAYETQANDRESTYNETQERMKELQQEIVTLDQQRAELRQKIYWKKEAAREKTAKKSKIGSQKG
jgi:predicted nuclease with TOPRIM domain